MTTFMLYKLHMTGSVTNINRAGITFIPIILSAAGSIHLSSRIALHFIADARSQRLNIPIHQGRSELMQRISAALHKGNAHCMLSHGAYVSQY
jgi:hypothetical protein